MESVLVLSSGRLTRGPTTSLVSDGSCSAAAGMLPLRGRACCALLFPKDPGAFSPPAAPRGVLAGTREVPPAFGDVLPGFDDVMSGLLVRKGTPTIRVEGMFTQ